MPPSGQSNTNRSVFCKDFTDNEADKFGEMLKAGREIRKPLSLSKVETLDRKRSRYKERNQKPTVTQRIPLKDRKEMDTGEMVTKRRQIIIIIIIITSSIA